MGDAERTSEHREPSAVHRAQRPETWGILIVDEHERVQLARGRAVLDVLAIPEDIVGRPAAEVLPSTLRDAFDRARASRSRCASLETERGGALVWLEAAPGGGEVALLLPTGEEPPRTEENLAEAQRLAHIGSFEWDMRSDRLVWSEEMARIHGVTLEEIGGTYHDYLACVHPEDREAVDRLACESVRSRRPLRLEHRIVRPDGSIRTLATRADVVTDGHSEVLRLVGSTWDESELVETRQARDRSVSLLHATLEATADGILVVDREGHIVAYNERFLSVWQVPRALAARADDATLLAFVREQLVDPDAFLRGVRDVYAHPEAESRDLLRFADGRVIERSSKPQRLGGEIIGRVWSFHDVSERELLLARAELLALASRLLTSLEAEKALEAVARLTIDRFAEVCAIDLVGHPEPRRLVEVAAPNVSQPHVEGLAGALCGRTAVETREGTSRISVPLAVRGEVFGCMTFGTRARVFERSDVELAEELGRRAGLALQNARLYATAREALHAREDLLAIAAHEIRGPITSLHLAAQSLRSDALPERVFTRLLDIIEREDRRLARFVDELLDIGRISSGTLDLSRDEVSLASVVNQVVADSEVDIARSGSSVTVSAADPAMGSWDRFRLERVVENLLSNALKFGRKRPIELRVASDDDTAKLWVIDRGNGIPEELQERVFEPFDRGRASTRHYGGLGLGLHIARTIVQALGGNVRVVSEPDRGSTFIVELPKRAS